MNQLIHFNGSGVPPNLPPELLALPEPRREHICLWLEIMQEIAAEAMPHRKIQEIVTLDDSPLNRSLWKGHDIDHITTRNGSGNQALSPDRHFGELIIYSPGLRS